MNERSRGDVSERSQKRPPAITVGRMPKIRSRGASREVAREKL